MPAFLTRALACLAVCLCLAAAPVQAKEPPVQSPTQNSTPNDTQGLFRVETFTLENGMEVVLIPSHRAPVVSHMLWYKVGAADEPPGKSGLAHFLEHLMFKGTETVPEGAFSKMIRKTGGNDNAFTSQDYTGFYQNIPRAQLELAMKLESDRMENLMLRPEAVDSERKVILEERRQRIENSPQRRFGVQVRNALHANHPYGIPTIGWRHEIKDLSYEDVMAFYRKWYTPSNAMLIVAGDVTLDEFKPLAEKYYGGIPAGEKQVRSRTVSPGLDAKRRVTMRNEQQREPYFMRVHTAPSAHAETMKDSLALDVMAEILGGGPTSRLYRSLNVDKKIAISVGSYYDSLKVDQGEIIIWATPAPGVDIKDVETAIDAEVARLLKDGANEDEVTRAIDRLRANMIYTMDDLQTPAYMTGQIMSVGLEPGFIRQWLDDVRHVTAADVTAAARKYLDPESEDYRPPVIGWLLPRESAPSDNDTAL